MTIYNTIAHALDDIHQKTVHFSPNKALGQNFLHNTNMARAIVDCLPHDNAIFTLEIGPGRGALTNYLRERNSPLCIIERDPYWATVHSTHSFTICADALQFDYSRLRNNTTPWQCIGNLPYNIASPLIWDIISKAQCYCVFMVQKEVGERLIAKEHSKEYGVLGIWIQSFCTPKKEYIVPPSAFFPAPKVHSMVLSFTPHTPDIIDSIPTHFADFLHYTFAHRRKQLLPRLRKRFPHSTDVFDALHLPYTVRAEELPIPLLQEITRTLYQTQ